VVIPDPALQAMLRGILGKPVDPITLYDIRNLQYLYDANLGIASIDGLQPAINVGYADFSDNFIHDASPMANWSTLQTLILDNNPLGNIAFASTLPQLAVLSLRNTGIRDVSPLAVETNLTFLDVSYDAITNAGSLAGATSLEVLDLDGTGIQDLSFVTNLPQLQSISFAHDEVRDLRPLLGLKNLVSVDLQDNGLDFSPGSSNAVVLAALEAAGVYIPQLAQTSSPFILSGSPWLYASNQLAIAFTCYPGRTYTLQASTNLVQWTSLAVLTNASFTNCFTNIPQGNFPRRFFRIAVIAAPPPLTLGVPVRNLNGTMSIAAFGVTKTSVLQTSSNLLQWTSVATNTATNSVIFIDASPGNGMRRFYRLWVP
jgi:hypothetical protein